MMKSPFDKIINRRHSESLKWNRYEEAVLPMWLADMDFECPENIIEALRKRIDHRVLGYSKELDELKEVIVGRLKTKHNFDVEAESIVYFPTPAYPPFIKEPQKIGLVCHDQELIKTGDGSYEVDFDEFDNSIKEADKLFILCNPHNPIGKVYTRNELHRIADICLKNKMIICSDDIHCETIYSGRRYFPIASLDKEIADNTIIMMSPSKAFNLAALKFSFAIIPNFEIRQKIIAIRDQLHLGANLLGSIATLVAYRDCQTWLDALNTYLEGNRDFMRGYIKKEIPNVKMNKVESTFLAWLDFHGTGITGNLHDFLKINAKVAVNDGVSFGKGGDGFIRLNFGCQRQRLMEALGRIKDAITA